MHTQHFSLTINYEGDNPSTFDEAFISDLVFNYTCESDEVRRLQTVRTVELTNTEVDRPDEGILAAHHVKAAVQSAKAHGLDVEDRYW